MTKTERQPSLNVYNAYKDGLFGHQHEDDAVREMQGMDIEAYHKGQQDFIWFCSVIGGRVLYAMHDNGALLTPWPIDENLASYMASTFDVDLNSVTRISFEEGSVVNDLPFMVLSDDEKMEKLHEWAEKQKVIPVLSPRTTTEETIKLAMELGISHIPTMPEGFNGGKLVDGIYPTLDYIEGHPAQVNNSKADNFELLQQMDKEMGTDFSPKGGVARNIEEVVALCDYLIAQGCEVMIKADLAVDGLGNVRIKDFTGRGDLEPSEQAELDARYGQRYQDLRYEDKKNYLLRLIKGDFKEGYEDARSILLSESTPVVVSEFLSDKVYDPSVEVYCPPQNWEVGPQIYYDCGMLIKSGFQGAIVGDPLLSATPSDAEAFKDYGIKEPEYLINHKEEYTFLMDQAKTMVLEFATRKWRDGYVGIMDCDFAVCLDYYGNMSIKILEFNFNRETGGTATYHIGQRLSGNLPETGYCIARDAVGKNIGNATDVAGIQEWSRGKRLDYLQNNKGLLVLGRRNNDGGMMTLVFAPTLQEAIELDSKMKKAAEEKQSIN